MESRERTLYACIRCVPKGIAFNLKNPQCRRSCVRDSRIFNLITPIQVYIATGSNSDMLSPCRFCSLDFTDYHITQSLDHGICDRSGFDAAFSSSRNMSGYGSEARGFVGADTSKRGQRSRQRICWNYRRRELGNIQENKGSKRDIGRYRPHHQPEIAMEAKFS